MRVPALTILTLLSALAAGRAHASNPTRNEDVDRAFALPAAPGARHVVHVRGHRFVPAELTVRLGDVLTFVNDDDELDYVYSNRLARGVELRAASSTPQVLAVLDRTGRVLVASGRWETARLVVQVVPDDAAPVSARASSAPRATARR